VLANGVDSKLRDDLERLKKIRAHRGLRHYWGLRVRGQHSKTTGRRGRTVGPRRRVKGFRLRWAAGARIRLLRFGWCTYGVSQTAFIGFSHSHMRMHDMGR
jgi:hypothetical protein